MNNPEYVVVAQIGRSQGLTGLFRLTLATDFPERLLELEEIYLCQREQPPRPVKILKTVQKHNHWFMLLEGFDSPEKIKPLSGAGLAIPLTELPDPPADSVYWFDLQDCDLVLEDGSSLGRVEAIERAPTCDLLVTRIEGEEVYVPFLAEIIVSVDKAAKKIVVRPLPGMLPADEN